MIAFAVVAALAVVALWDGVRRALASQVALASLRVEAMKRADYDSVREELRLLEARINTVASDHRSLETGLAVGRRNR